MSDPQSESVLDPDVIGALLALEDDGAPGLFNELVDLFVSDTPARLESLSKAVAGSDLRTIEEVAHSLKSSCGNLGAMGLSALFRDIEALGREQTIDGVAELFAKSQAEYALVEKALRDART